MRVGTLLRRLIAEGQVTDPDSPKGRLLGAAARLFRQKGYSRTTVRDLAAEVGILSGSIFHHFANKDEILFGVMIEVVTAMEEMLKVSLAEATTTREKVRVLIDNELLFIHGKTGDAAAVLIYEWRALSEERQRQVLERRDNYYRLWNECLQQAHDEGLITVDPDCLRQLLHGAIVWTVHWYEADGEMSLEQLGEQVLNMALKGEP
ncbi:TetR/AcrR family transcriptional regulator [Motiliproteus coralliicola]|uniref:TetR/AcrR family transcriptional regulator n=1 Tax=Motiliproteus coralliicola TaxID=2283196 RepID=A0A369WY07_9GAMM|nr:TetR/AcrR family transcriptional regulator [Motiliproteus coralliicola]RDE24375.1 TetR/AcrR family transcriptional regulator [Motiliproteus coralliicola]